MRGRVEKVLVFVVVLMIEGGSLRMLGKWLLWASEQFSYLLSRVGIATFRS
jgi:hypothetical protein